MDNNLMVLLIISIISMSLFAIAQLVGINHTLKAMLTIMETHPQ